MERVKEEVEVALDKQRKESREELRKAVVRMRIKDEVVRTQKAKVSNLRIKNRELLEEKMKLKKDNRI